MSFENDPRRKQELRGRPIADAIYKRVFGPNVKVERFERKEEIILDIKFALDVKLTLPNGQILLGQEKFLSHYYSKFRSVTVEYWQNSTEPGDWYKLGAQFYFVGYFTRDNQDFDPWVMLNWPEVVTQTHQGNVTWMTNKNKDGRARANFQYCVMDRLPDSCVMACSFEETDA